MRKSRKILAMIMAIAIAATFLVGLTASAADETGVITIKAPENSKLTLQGQQFFAYRIFVSTYRKVGDEYKFTYTIDPRFAAFETTYATELGGKSLFAYLADDSRESYSDEMNALGALLWEYILARSIVADGNVLAGAAQSTINMNVPYQGYYLVYGTGYADGDTENTVVAAVALTTTKPNAEIVLKADAPVLDKFVKNQHDDINDWIKWTDVSIGTTVEFKLVSKVPKMTGYTASRGGYKFTIHDKMSAGLTFDSTTVQIYVGGVLQTSGYSIYEGAALSDGCTFEIIFNPIVFVTYVPGREIVVTYKAVLNENAIVGLYGNPNDAQLEYSDNPYSNTTNRTPWKRVKVYTGRFGIIKIIGDDAAAAEVTTLPGAEFELWKDAAGTTKVFFVKQPNETIDGKTVFVYKVVKDGTVSGATPTMVTPANGYVRIDGLGASYAGNSVDYDGYGNYWLKETKAPDGYFPRGDAIPVILKISSDYQGDMTDSATEATWTLDGNKQDNTLDWFVLQGGVGVKNYSPEFPETGGIGRRIFIVGGIALMGLAVVGLVVTSISRKKKTVIN